MALPEQIANRIYKEGFIVALQFATASTPELLANSTKVTRCSFRKLLSRSPMDLATLTDTPCDLMRRGARAVMGIWDSVVGCELS